MPCPHICPASPIINTPRQSGTFVTIDEPPGTHPPHPESAFGGRVPSWYPTFHRYCIIQSMPCAPPPSCPGKH